MSDFCESNYYLGSSEKQKKTLWSVLFINLTIFIVLIYGANWGDTVSLFADSFDSLGDAITYGVSILVLGSNLAVKAKVSLLKGVIILLGAFSVMVCMIYKWYYMKIPTPEIMGGFSIFALIANVICLVLLSRHKNEDINMESVWHCSRNDIVSNLSVLLASILVWFYNSWIPDMLLGFILFIFLFKSGLYIINKSYHMIRNS